MFERARARLRQLGPLFLVTVVVPTVIAVLYFGLVASDVFISEARFVVRTPERPTASSLGDILKGSSFGSRGQDSYVVQEFIQSRDALAAINRNGVVEAAYSRPAISLIDRFDPLGIDGSFEALYRYYGRVVGAEHDTLTSVTTLTVRAYDPDTALALNRQLIAQAEALVNRLNTRSRRDLVTYGETEVVEAQTRAREASAALAAYRNDAQVLDPERQAQVQVLLVSRLQEALIATRGQAAQVRALAPDNPQLPILVQRIGELEREIATQSSRVAGGGSGSFAAKTREFQRRQFNNEFAQRALATALASANEARNEARRKQIYLERIVEPNRPDDALEPRRLRGIFATFVLGLVFWGIFSMLIAGVREHKD